MCCIAKNHTKAIHMYIQSSNLIYLINSFSSVAPCSLHEASQFFTQQTSWPCPCYIWQSFLLWFVCMYSFTKLDFPKWLKLQSGLFEDSLFCFLCHCTSRFSNVLSRYLCILIFTWFLIVDIGANFVNILCICFFKHRRLSLNIFGTPEIDHCLLEYIWVSSSILMLHQGHDKGQLSTFMCKLHKLPPGTSRPTIYSFHFALDKGSRYNHKILVSQKQYIWGTYLSSMFLRNNNPREAVERVQLLNWQARIVRASQLIASSVRASL